MTGPAPGSRRHDDAARRLALVVDLGTGGPKVCIATLD